MYAMASLWFESALLPGGWAGGVRLTAAGGAIARIETGVTAAPGDERHGIALPGLDNLHSHAFQRGLAGLTERRGRDGDSFWTWRELMYRFVERIDPEQLEALTAFAFAEMLEGGFTRVGEFHYLHHDQAGAAYAAPAELAARVVAAAADTGIALTLLPTLYAHGGFGGAPAAARQRRFLNGPERFARIVEECRTLAGALAGGYVAVAAHSLRAVTPPELTALVQLAGDGLIHIHIAEQLREVEECRAWCGRRPVQWLLENAPVDARWCLVHATHVDEEELAGIAASGATVGLCPITECSLGDGIFPAAEFRAAGGRAGIGSDSNIRLDAAEELRTLEYTQRLAHRARNVLAAGPGASTGRSLFDAALAGGARALRPAGTAVGLAPGAPLDLLTLRAEHAALTGRQGDELLDSWIFAGDRGLIDCVWRAGVRLVSGGRHRARERLEARYARALRALLA